MVLAGEWLRERAANSRCRRRPIESPIAIEQGSQRYVNAGLGSTGSQQQITPTLEQVFGGPSYVLLPQ